MRNSGKTAFMIEQIKSMKGFVIVPCRNVQHARFLLDRFLKEGLKAQVNARVDKGLQPQQNKSRRTIRIEIFN